MSREIKFRVWDKEEKKFFEPIYQAYAGRLFDLSISLSGELMMRTLESPAIHESKFPNRFIIQQYTNLKDKNGKKIYEGDIGEIKTQSGRIERFTVEYGIHRRDMKSGWTVDIPSFAFVIDGKPTFPIVDNYLNGHDLDIIEIIGNIYEDPELLTPLKTTT